MNSWIPTCFVLEHHWVFTLGKGSYGTEEHRSILAVHIHSIPINVCNLYSGNSQVKILDFRTSLTDDVSFRDIILSPIVSDAYGSLECNFLFSDHIFGRDRIIYLKFTLKFKIKIYYYPFLIAMVPSAELSNLISYGLLPEFLVWLW